ncbi:hypothetical protein N7470_005293 [Penicillium chermesinum]|nr:hypothetical protein N7470_005293 [Penicillium chermesinum]
MAFKEIFTDSTIALYAKQIRAAPRPLIFNKKLLLSALCYATSSLPVAWDQSSSSTIPDLPGFQGHFGFSNSSAGQLRYFVSIPFASAGVGALLSWFLNDRIGRLWSWRLYTVIWMIGQLVMCFTPTLTGLWVARVICGLGIGPLSVVGNMAIVEIAPTEIRGLLSVWYSVFMVIASVCAVFSVMGCYIHIVPSRLQYQVVWFSPCVFFALLIAGSFYVCESPRWLWMVDRHDEAVKTLVEIRGLPAEHPRVKFEIEEIKMAIAKEKRDHSSTSSLFISNVKETFTVRSNLRRVQQTFASFALAQISGANSITSYLIPILKLLGQAGDTTHGLFLSGMYSTSKIFFTLIACFFLVDSIGRRRCLMLGACLQMCSDIYLGVYLKYEQAGSTSTASSQGALAFMFIHALGYAIGLYMLPYLFGGEVWPNRIRSFGGAISQCFHWLFFFAMLFALPSLLDATNNWGAFLFFAGCCFLAQVYVFFMVPETSGLSVEELDEVFEGPWLSAYRYSRKRNQLVIEAADLEIQK